jgi:hypothetical protein
VDFDPRRTWESSLAKASGICRGNARRQSKRNRHGPDWRRVPLPGTAFRGPGL